MKLEGKHYALIAAFLAGVGTQLATAQHGWSDVLTTGFVAGLLIQVSTLITAIFVGAPGASAALDQANKNTDMANATTRAALKEPVDLAGVDPKRFVGPGAAVVACLLLSGCASAPPAGADPKQVHATQLLNDVQLLVQVAQVLHDSPGTFALSDQELVLVKDYAASAGAGIQAYKDGKGNLALVSAGFHQLLAGLSADAKLNDRLRFVLTLVDSALSVAVGSRATPVAALEPSVRYLGYWVPSFYP